MSSKIFCFIYFELGLSSEMRAPTELTREVYNLFQEPVELSLGFSIAEEQNQTVLKTKQVKKLAASWPRQTCN